MSDRTKISPTEVFFLSFGGQSPFISLIAFGTEMILYVGTDSGFAMMVTTLLVMANASVIYSLSKRFTKGGGYYTYALHALTSDLGITTGWMYILYSLSYGGTLMLGGVYVLEQLTGIDPLLLSLLVTIIASAIVIGGVKLSARYAVAVGILEIIAILGLSFYFLFLSGFKFYNPIPSKLPENLPEAILFGIGIPSGYSSVVSFPEEIQNAAKTVSRTSILVPLLGGGLASLFFYSLAAMNFQGNMVSLLLSLFGTVGGIFIAAIAMSDAVLGGIAYLLAGSRTLFNMAKNQHFTSLFSIEYKGQPKVAEVIVSIFVVLTSFFLVRYFGIFTSLGLIAGIAGLSNLYIHMAASVSLARMGRRKPRKHVHEIVFSVFSLVLSSWILFVSFGQLEKYVVYFFLGWIILGFLLAESLEMLREEESGK
ncbi:APC family permease [Metallosphaera tengchongensis]|uniref:APC family permease n=1 Tax=Metallosphaera tengchongensis TaxID=1532350 RepID=A0A6N0NSG6_9CREN|nr:APC family permease [Metallosphaera tengchongensis]QKQ99134.1 APC family permease [Metallosphaera tengchongensis]